MRDGNGLDVQYYAGGLPQRLVGYDVLTHLPALATGARIVAVSSDGHHLSAIRWNDPQLEGGYDKWLAYGQSKAANALFAVQLDALARSRGVRAFSLHPGSIPTPLQRHISQRRGRPE